MKFSFTQKQFIEVDITPEKLAIIGMTEALTWKEFNSELTKFCQFLIENKCNELTSPVLIYGHKQIEMILAIYACMSLEIAYIPVDAVYPKERIKSIKEIAEVQLVINCFDEPLKLENTQELKYVDFNPTFISKIELKSSKDLKPDPLVYLIFTSGSTGEPKGVQITSESLVSFTNWMMNDFGFTPQDVFVNVALFSFDLSVYELMTFGAIGGTLLLNSKQVTENPEILMERIHEFGGTILVSTPSFSFIFSRLESEEKLNSLKYFLFCGEILPNNLALNLRKKFPATKIYNTYGPTEATVATTLVEITDEIIKKHNPLPVGKAKPESYLLIENDEIIIVGKNVSIGYLNRPELNAEKFIQIEGQRAFKTGDLGFLENGMLFCKGRNDDQVKLRGFRIELNEISSKIEAIDFVLKAETIALRRNDEVKKIVSLVELRKTNDEDIKTIITEILSKTMPEYMVPSDIRVIDKIPLNQNGKADKKMLEAVYLGKA